MNNFTFNYVQLANLKKNLSIAVRIIFEFCRFEKILELRNNNFKTIKIITHHSKNWAVTIDWLFYVQIQLDKLIVQYLDAKMKNSGAINRGIACIPVLCYVQTFLRNPNL